MTSVFDIFKPGVGPSSSHTMGPMTAAADFLDLLRVSPAKDAAAAVRVTLYGSLAFTGKGHATDRAVSLGLLGYRPADIEMAGEQIGAGDYLIEFVPVQPVRLTVAATPASVANIAAAMAAPGLVKFL